MGRLSRYGDRPLDKITVEELRIEIASVAGPFRTCIAGAHRRVDLTAGIVALICANKSAPCLFVDVRMIDGVAIDILLFSPHASADRDSNVGIDMAAETFQQVLLQSESLFAVSAITTSVMVTEVQV